MLQESPEFYKNGGWIFSWNCSMSFTHSQSFNHSLPGMWSLWPKLSYTFSRWLWVKAEREKSVWVEGGLFGYIQWWSHDLWHTLPFLPPTVATTSTRVSTWQRNWFLWGRATETSRQTCSQHTPTHTGHTVCVSTTGDMLVRFRDLTYSFCFDSCWSYSPAGLLVHNLVGSRLLRQHFGESRLVQLLSPCTLTMIR